MHSPLVMAIVVTTTALGTLLPILRDNDMLGGRFGRYVFASGAVGELGPIVAVGLFLGSAVLSAEMALDMIDPPRHRSTASGER